MTLEVGLSTDYRLRSCAEREGGYRICRIAPVTIDSDRQECQELSLSCALPSFRVCYPGRVHSDLARDAGLLRDC
eukprot:252818-Prorocentrum_minimum.AAC.1